MSDYTPTTEEVRGGYAYDGWLHKPVQVRLKGFDRWYAEEIRKAKHDAWQESAHVLLDPAMRKSSRNGAFIVEHHARKIRGVLTTVNPYKEES